MSVYWLLVFLVLALDTYVEGGLNELCEQMDYYQKSPLLSCLRYDDYGCWCGPGGSGKPVDGAGNYYFLPLKHNLGHLTHSTLET